MRWVGDLYGEPAVLYKEKVNYKHPGGGGFAYHQDAPAYRFVDHHISCMVPLDDATVASGCLYVAPGYDQGQMPTDERGRIDETFAKTLDWRPVEVFPGDVLIFDSYTPHHSGTNTSAHARRAFYLTYNAASKGPRFCSHIFQRHGCYQYFRVRNESRFGQTFEFQKWFLWRPLQLLS